MRYSVVFFLCSILFIATSVYAKVNRKHHILHSFDISWQEPDHAILRDALYHADQMGYTVISNPNVTSATPQKTLMFNALVAPMRLDSKFGKVYYHDFYNNGNGYLSFNKRPVGKWMDITPTDTSAINRLAYSTSGKIGTVPVQSFDNLIKTWNFNGKFNVVGNWCSSEFNHLVLDHLKDAIVFGDFKNVFLDSFDGNTYPCSGSDTTFRSNKFATFNRLMNGLQSDNPSHDVDIFANIWDPLVNSNRSVLEEYAGSRLRFFHYFIESGTTLAANGSTPDGKPAFTSGSGYLPADVVSLDVPYDFFKDSRHLLSWKRDYLNVHYETCLVALRQGSWFGWYGEDSLFTIFNKQRVHSHAHMLLRAIPNWENLSEIPLDARNLDDGSYQSINTIITRDIVASKKFDSNLVYVVPLNSNVSLDISKWGLLKKIVEADPLFGPSGELEKNRYQLDAEREKIRFLNLSGKGVILHF